MKIKHLHVVLTDNQEAILEAKARASGFVSKSDYVRFMLFLDMTVLDKVNKIYDKVMTDAK